MDVKLEIDTETENRKLLLKLLVDDCKTQDLRKYREVSFLFTKIRLRSPGLVAAFKPARDDGIF